MTARTTVQEATRPQSLAALLTLVLTLLQASPVVAQQTSIAAAERLIEDGRHAEAKAMLLNLARHQPQDVRVAALAGRVHYFLQEGDAAVSQLERAVRLDSGNGLHQLWLGEAYGLQLASANRLRQRAIVERMRRAFEQAIAVEPGLEAAYVRLIQYYVQAPPRAGGDPGRAREHALALARINPYGGSFLLATVEQASGDSAAAERTFARMVSLFPDSITPRAALLASHMERGRFDESWALLEPLAEAVRVETWVLFMVGRWSALSGRELDRGERALREHLRRALTRPEEGTHPGAHVRLGQILLHRGNTAGARREYEAALRLDKDFQPARDALRALH